MGPAAMRDTENRRLWAYSAVAGSVSVAVSGVATMWLPTSWSGFAWAALAIALCTACGLLAPRVVLLDDDREVPAGAGPAHQEDA